MKTIKNIGLMLGVCLLLGSCAVVRQGEVGVKQTSTEDLRSGSSRF